MTNLVFFRLNLFYRIASSLAAMSNIVIDGSTSSDDLKPFQLMHKSMNEAARENPFQNQTKVFSKKCYDQEKEEKEKRS